MNIYQHKVQYYETDQMGVVHHSNYIRWMEESRIDFLSQIGCDYKSMEERGIISPVVSVNAKYLKSACFGDEVAIRVWIEEFKGVVLKLGYEMLRGEEVVCKGSSEHCFLNPQKKIMNMRKESPEIFKILSNLVASEKEIG